MTGQMRGTEREGDRLSITLADLMSSQSGRQRIAAGVGRDWVMNGVSLDPSFAGALG
jgi:hypothetical protein